MKKGMKKALILTLSFMTLLMVWNQTLAQVSGPPTIQLRLMETTDLHGNMIGYNYENRKKTVEFGLSRTANLIKQAREEVPNSLLFDNGDILEGNALDEYAYRSHPLDLANVHPVFKAMNTLLYDAATVGNHEFNYGIDFMEESLRGANFPYINANIYVEDRNHFENDDLNYFNPYTILEKEVTDTAGEKHKLNIGVIGFITPIVAEWNKEYFRGNLKVKNIKETAEHFIPIMKNKGADIIVALAHTGLQSDKGLDEKKGNSVYALSKVKGIDAILFGHSHSVFPVRDELQKLPGIDLNAGTINGTAAVQAGYWGNHLGLIDLKIVQQEGSWKVKSSLSSIRPVYRTINKKSRPAIPTDPLIEQIMRKDHKETLDFLKDKK
ncbi:2',3'-cyclic-nucleotide 2'-phosphodiesterase/3'-nucleotidase [Cytobacillus oceanisediminis]|uniref:2',3'-cyclic-nucleotide 2'-phosphodiesterase/3'-nucleotidase n=1 Tax=Cytobacillus oceanisediminis TaxID=665099 RepID=A0A2V3A6P9_9BACI|nr:metallophosphoesterase [Cytobacillus oceanisediminis]PWW31841.1 2',3'-cyclic-nucleotide 2'-phosphodiesterase/3'-nucleotidase [Cytobacillus oceanisediminis]